MKEYIERNAAIDHVYDCCMESSSCNMNCIKDIPAADVVPVRHGRWIHSTDAEDGRCSICNCDMPMFKEDWEWRYCETPYCPNCGANMRDNTQKTSVDEEVKHD